MSYNDVAAVAADQDLRNRIAAAYAAEQPADATYPPSWADTYQWELAGSPGWGDAWASAVAGGNPAPGRDESVITDAMILSAVQAQIAAGP